MQGLGEGELFLTALFHPHPTLSLRERALKSFMPRWLKNWKKHGI